MHSRLSLLFCLVSMSFAAEPGPLDVALRQASSGDCAAAARTLEPLLKSTPPPVAPVYALLSGCYAQLNRVADAEQVLRSGLKVRSAEPVLERSLGQLLMRQSMNSPEAGGLLRHSTEAAPRDPEARHYYAQWAYFNSRDRICAEQEQAALKLPGLNDVALLQMNTLLALCAARIEDVAAARAAFTRANNINLARKPYDPVAAWQYVQFLGRFGVDAEVQPVVNQILEREPSFGPARLERAKFLDRSGQPAKAIDEAKQVLRAAGIDLNNERAAHALMARSYMALGMKEDAAREQAWIEAHPNPETPR